MSTPAPDFENGEIISLLKEVIQDEEVFAIVDKSLADLAVAALDTLEEEMDKGGYDPSESSVIAVYQNLYDAYTEKEIGEDDDHHDLDDDEEFEDDDDDEELDEYDDEENEG